MAREKFERNKPHVNVGTIGHVDHGKTTLDGGDHQGAGEERSRPERGVRPDRQGTGGARAWNHDRNGPR